MKQKIEFEELQKWYESEEVTFASSTRERKRLTCTLKGTFIVRVAGNIVWQGVQPFAAVEAYNNVTQKFIQEPFKL
jgi:hypothetical protein